jgi:hypothetical protein
VKRLLTLMLAMGLPLIGPSPVSLCALFSSLPGECTRMETKAQCEKMDMTEHPSRTLTAGSTSCCVVSQAPLPESKNEASPTCDARTSAGPLVSLGKVIEPDNAPVVSGPRDPSPPPQQSLLCTFLI